MDANTRKSIYALLILLSLGLILGRILAVDTVDNRSLQKYRLNQIPKQLAEKEKRLRDQGATDADIQNELAATEAKLQRDATLCFPFFSANDRSRWCTIRAVVDPEMRVEGAPFAIDKVRMEKGWDTIDMVCHDGHYYSSKPPLFPAMLAGVYWLIRACTGLTLGANTYEVVKLMLMLVNGSLMFVFLLSVSKLAERLGKSDWSRIFIVAAASFATFLSTFCVTLNNHLPAVTCVSVSLLLAVELVLDGKRALWRTLLIGLCAAFAVVNELPAASFLVAIFVAIAVYLPWKDARGQAIAHVVAFAAGALVVVVPFFATNVYVHHSLKPPYMHRSKTDPNDNWYAYTYTAQNGKVVNSYWQEPKGLDLGEPSRAKYAFHVLIGQHGVFSLTPLWLLALAGMGFWLRDEDLRLRLFALMILALTVLILGFYICRPLQDRNYGGMCCGFRWAFWLIPMWLCTLLPALERLEPYRWGKILAVVLLAFSAISVSYPLWTPWTLPWLCGF